jgi:hypothetical protein
MLHAEPIPSGLWQWFYPTFLCAISREQNPFNTGIVKGITNRPKAAIFDHGFTSALFETSHLIK